MEQKTAEEILKDELNNYQVYLINNTPYLKIYILDAIQSYADQEVSKAIDKALEIVEDKLFDTINWRKKSASEIKKSILSLKPEILKELKK